MELNRQIARLYGEIAALESAIEAVRNEQIRPSNPSADNVFGILKANLASIEHDRESREFERERARRIDVFETSLAEMRSQLATLEKRAEEEAIQKAERESVISKCFDRLQSALQSVETELSFLEQKGFDISREIKENFPVILEGRVLPRFQRSWYTQPKFEPPRQLTVEEQEATKRSIAAAAVGKSPDDPSLNMEFTRSVPLDRVLHGLEGY